MDTSSSRHDERRMSSPFERYLTVWVLLCIGAGILLGRLAPDLAAMRELLQKLLQARAAPAGDELAHPNATLAPCRIPTG